MPASTLDPVNTALRANLSRTPPENNIDAQLAGSTKKALLANIDFEAGGNTHSPDMEKLKTKYILIKKPETPQPSKPDNVAGDETLKPAKLELYPLEAVQLGWNNSDWLVGAGMVNMGNTCYLNSTLQALFHVPALVNWLISDKQHMAECEDSGGLCIVCAMRKTLQDSQQRNANSIRPFLIYNKLRLVCRNLIPGRQEDAHEFLRYLVEAMEKSYLNRFKNHCEFDSRTKETTPLNQILGGYLRSAVRCLDCGHVSTTFQHFQDLLLDIRKAQTLDEALEGYFSREKLDDESYHCESCQKKVPATKQFFVERAPMVLCIQLKRFSVSNNKITKHIQFRQRLDLTRYTRQKPTVPLVYRLVALVTHMGPTVNCGHYTAVAQAPCGNFYQFDDSMVRPISHQAVFTTNAYIMLYELECAPFSKKMNGTNGTNGAAKLKPVTHNASYVNTTVEKQQNASNNTSIPLNTSNKIYGPELPPHLETLQNNNTNGKTHKETSSSDSESETPPIKLFKENKISGIINVVSRSLPELNAKLPLTPKPLSRNNSNSSLSSVSPHCSTVSTNTSTNVNTSNYSTVIALGHPSVTSTTQSITKLVPYDDESSSSEDSLSNSPNEINSRVSTKAAIGEWKVTSTTGSNGHEPPTPNSKDWNKKKMPNDRTTVNELLKMSHSGYSSPVASWSGARSQLDKEINNERREDRKRTLEDNTDQGRMKHAKITTNGNLKSNPGYNPIQEYHSAKNWSQNTNSQQFRPFFNVGNRHRNSNRRNFHHKNYHKNYRFRQ